MSAHYLFIPEMTVSDCNLESSYLTTGVSMTAVAGFADLILRGLNKALAELNANDQGLLLTGTLRAFAVCLHDYQCYTGYTKNPLTFCEGNGGKPAEDKIQDPPMTSEIKGRLRLSLIIELENSVLGEINGVEQVLHQVVMNARLSGGDIVAIAKAPGVMSRGLAGLGDILGKLRAGYFIAEPAFDFNLDQEPLSHIFDALKWARTEDGIRRTNAQRYPGWLFATCVGYVRLDTSTEREGRRDTNVLHSFGEPLLTLVELCSSRRVITKTGNSLDLSPHVWWQWEINERVGACWLRSMRPRSTTTSVNELTN